MSDLTDVPPIPTGPHQSHASQSLRRVFHLAQLAAVVRACPGLHVRYSPRPDDDSRRHSIDTESGLELPVAVLTEELLEEARARYEENFEAGRGPADAEGES